MVCGGDEVAQALLPAGSRLDSSRPSWGRHPASRSAKMSLGAADTSGERSRSGTSLAPLTVAAGSRRTELSTSASESVSWVAVSNRWLVESVRATTLWRALKSSRIISRTNAEDAYVGADGERQ